MEVVALVIAVIALLALVIVGWLYGRMYPYVAQALSEEAEELADGSTKPASVHEVLTEGSTQPPGKA